MNKGNLFRSIALSIILTILCVYLLPSYTFADEASASSEPTDEIDTFTGDPRVLDAQQWLNETYAGQYTYTEILENGRTGFNTVNALIIALQIELGMEYNSTGSFGPTTASLCPTVSMGNPGNNINIIRIIQHGLFCKGYGAYDMYGTFGTETTLAVENLERDAGLNSTGVVTPLIFKAILNTDPYVLNYSKGDSNIRFIQQSLNKKYNEYCGLMPCDGIYGRSTNKALIYALQAEEGLSTSVANGNFGPTTASLCPSLKVGDSRSNFVVLLQYALYCNGYLHNILDISRFDGVYDSGIASEVKKFQEFMCLNATGNADKGTLMSLFTSCGDTTRSSEACDTATKLNKSTTNTIVSAGYKYVGRYLTNTEGGTLDKKMTDDEINLILTSGRSIVPIYQTYGGAVTYYTVEQAVKDAKSADKAAREFGIPEGNTIYFAVDYDAYDFQVTDAIIPYFKKIYETIHSLGNGYNIGIYAPRNVCNRVYDARYVDYCYVSDASKGYSGNLGYCMPKEWAFDQFAVDKLIGYNEGTIYIDKVAYSGRNSGFSYIEKDLAAATEIYWTLEYLKELIRKDTRNEQIEQTIYYCMNKLRENKLVRDNPKVVKNLAEMILHSHIPTEDELFNLVIDIIRANSSYNEYFLKWETQKIYEDLSELANLIPVIGDIKGFYETYTGEELATERKLQWWEKAVNIVCVIGIIGDIADVLKLEKVAIKEYKVANLVLELERDVGRITESELKSILSIKDCLIDNSDSIFETVKSVTRNGDEIKIVDAAGQELTFSREQLKNELKAYGYTDEAAENILNMLEFGCFTGDTLVTTNNGSKRIDEINKGDFVLAKDVETGKIDYKEVLNVYIKSCKEFVYIYVDGEEIKTTKGHLFYVGEWWKSAQNIKIGDKILTSDGKYKEVKNVEFVELDEPEKIYNLNVDEFHTYFVGKNNLLVHNSCWNWADLVTLENHFKDHGHQFGATTKEEYAKIANEFYNRSLSDAKILEKIDDNESVIRLYDQETNTFGVYTYDDFNFEDGFTITFFKPDDGIDYFMRQPGDLID